MKQLQKWFDLIAGISEEEQRKLAIAHAIFGQRGPDLSELNRPACWRRSSHVRLNRR